jgi:3',5'-cyclic AMP phosphodiesterase CpdA
MRRLFMFWVLLLAGSVVAAFQAPALPGAADSLKFAVIGDNGSGERPQYEVAEQMALAHGRFPFELVLMLGDNIYGSQRPEDFVTKFERPYAPLLKAGVLFYASLGNHDNPNNRFYPGFNMGGERYYTFVRRKTRFLALDTNQMDAKQLAWIEDVLQRSQEDWKICYFHHPLYSNAARHGSDVGLRVLLEPRFVKHGVNVVFAGHDHVYERIQPQKGITHFVGGSSGQLRRGDMRRSAVTAASNDQEQAFILVEIEGDDLFFETRSRSGRTIDSGLVRRQTRNAAQGRP